MERSAESPIGNMPIEAPTGPVIPELSDQPCSNFGMADQQYMPRHNPAVTAQGKHGRKAEYFFDKPVFLDDFPSRHDFNEDDEPDTDEDEDEGN